MLPRILIVGLFCLIVSAAVVAIAQPPTLPPLPTLPQPTAQPQQQPTNTVPGPATGTPGAIIPSTPVNETPLSHFEPLAAFSAHAQNAVRATLLTSNWMTRMNQSQGRFIYGFNPALRQPLLRDNNLHQARASLAMAQLAKFTGDERQGAIASQSILTLLAATGFDPANANCRIPFQSSQLCNRVGFAATLALAIYSLPGADAKLIDEAEKLCEFLHKQCRAGGSVQYTDGTADVPMEVDPAGVNEYPGVALQAIMTANRFRPAAWKTDVAKLGMTYYRGLFQAKPHPLLAATLTPVCLELFQQLHLNESAAFAFEMNDLICRNQIPNNDPRIPQWVGGIRTYQDGQQTDLPSGPETGLYVQSLTFACQLAGLAPDLTRYGQYKSAAQDATQYMIELQYAETNTRHFENAFRSNMLIGAFHLSPTDGNIRIDATATSATSLLHFLSLVAQTE
ncbi:MAG TPA: hypothetical protein VG097_09090 [Gemmata sp.]|jgi:hypothetical protein|nr:hypothetical protein [Gemmata sp.]